MFQVLTRFKYIKHIGNIAHVKHSERYQNDVIEVNLVVLLLTLPVPFADKERKLT